MINPHLLTATSQKIQRPYQDKSYRAALTWHGLTIIGRTVHRRAAQAQAHAIRLRARWQRLYDAMIAAKVAKP